jgi:16S rRNA C967 or C1407 C5-methylase (RsmB/RsmF family)
MAVLRKDVVEKYAARILPSEEQSDFVASLCEGSNSRQGVVWLRNSEKLWDEEQLVSPDLLPQWISVPHKGIRAGSFKEHDRGDYYCADISSIILGAGAGKVAPYGCSLVDLCAAPGGKSILLWRYLAPRITACNEVVRKRVKILISNLNRCRIVGARVYSMDVRDLAQSFSGIGDLIVADVPCSAQSLGQRAEYPFSQPVIHGNVVRQRRILNNCLAIVKPGGLLAYITCTFSPKENEENIQWFLKRNPDFSPIAIPGYDWLQSPFASFPGYRIWPHKGLGRGGFLCVLKRDGESVASSDLESEFPRGIHQVD